MMRILTTMLVLFAGTSSGQTQEMEKLEPFHCIVAPAGPQNPRNSEAAIVPLRDGTLLLAWTEFNAGDSADHGPARIAARLSGDGGRTWSL